VQACSCRVGPVTVMPGCYVQAALAVAAGADPAAGLFVLLVLLGVLQQPGGMTLRALVGQVHVG